jgi:plasmid maintenance system antidote protein VapI
MHAQHYDPNSMLNAILWKLRLKNDAALCRIAEVNPAVISKIRHNRMPVSAAVLLRLHEVTGMSVKALQDLMGDRRLKFRLSTAQGRPGAENAM